MHTSDQERTIEELCIDHGDVTAEPIDDLDGSLFVQCDDGFSCVLSEDGEMLARRGNTATFAGAGWSS